MTIARIISLFFSATVPAKAFWWLQRQAPRIILLFIGATVLTVAVRRLRAYRLKERHMLMFVFTGLPFLVLAIWPTGVGWLAVRLDINYQTVSMLCIAAWFLILIFELLTIISLQDRKISTLAQMVGIMMEQQGISDRPIVKPPGSSESKSPGVEET